jgi:hypothetical protein
MLEEGHWQADRADKKAKWFKKYSSAAENKESPELLKFGLINHEKPGW